MPVGHASSDDVKPTITAGDDKTPSNIISKEDEMVSTPNSHRITAVEIQKVQNSIEQCLQLYMTRQDVVATLLHQANIEARFTSLVWQKLEEQNPEFFRAYYTRLKLKDQIVLFNNMLEHHAQLMQKLQGGYQNAGNDPQGNPNCLGMPGHFPGSGMQAPHVAMNGMMMSNSQSLGFHYNPMEQNPFMNMPGQHPGELNNGMHMMGMVPNHMGGSFVGSGGGATFSDMPFGSPGVSSGMTGSVTTSTGLQLGPSMSSPLPSTSYSASLLGEPPGVSLGGFVGGEAVGVGGGVSGDGYHPLTTDLGSLPSSSIHTFSSSGNGPPGVPSSVHQDDHADDMLSHLPRNFSFTDLSMELTSQLNDETDPTLALFPNVPSTMESLELGNRSYRIPRNFSLSDMSLEFDRET